ASPLARARLRFAVGMTHFCRGRYREAGSSLEEAAQLAREAADEHVRCWALTYWCYAAVYSGRPALAAPLLVEAEPLSRRVSDPAVEMFLSVVRGFVDAVSGRIP